MREVVNAAQLKYADVPAGKWEVMERLLGIKEAAELLDVSEDWVRDHAAPRPGCEPRRTPVIPVVRLGGGIRQRLKFRVSDLEAFIQNARVDGAAMEG